MSTDKPRQPIDWKSRGLDWVFSQGVSTVLLMLICFGLWYGIPWARTCIKEDLREIHSANKEALDSVIQTWNSHVDKTINAFKEDQARDQELLDRVLDRNGLQKQVGEN